MDHHGKTTWGTCPATLHKAYQKLVTTVSLGEARTLQAPHSDVSLDVPENSPGIYTMQIQTNITRSSADMPDSECLISPIVELVFEKLDSRSHLPEKMGMCAVNIPHCLTDSSQWSWAKVHHISSKTQPHKNDEFSRTQTTPVHGTFDIHEKNISVYTTSFSKFVCTSCKNVCEGAILSFIFGRLTPLPGEDKSTVDLKMFMGSPLFAIADFENVRKQLLTESQNKNKVCSLRKRHAHCQCFQIYFQHLKESMQDVGMTLAEKGGICITQKSTDLEASFLTSTVGPGSQAFGPEVPDTLWVDEKGIFTKVCTQFIRLLLICKRVISIEMQTF